MEKIIIMLLDFLKVKTPKLWAILVAVYSFIFVVINVDAFNGWIESTGAAEWVVQLVNALLFVGTLLTGARTTENKKRLLERKK